MNRDSYQRIKKVFNAALERSPDERKAFIEQVCPADNELRQEVESLLATYQSDFLEQPAIGEAAAFLEGDYGSPLQSGQKIGRYEIKSKLGSGGMGDVFLAQDKELKRQVAIKVLHSDVAKDKERVRRFLQEARAASALNHPNILTIYEVGESDGWRFIVSEYVEGKTLRERLKGEPLSIEESLDIATQIAAALNAAHSTGIVHRDIKPENVMLRKDGLVKVLDFGLAKLTDQKFDFFDAEASTLSQVQTASGMIMGTVAYMSPEQARGKETDARTDVWSLGIVLYEMITGKQPFTGETSSDTVAAILKSELPPLFNFNSDIVASLERLVSKALRKNSRERYQNINELLLDLKLLRQNLKFTSERHKSANPTSSVTTTQLSSIVTDENNSLTFADEFLDVSKSQNKPNTNRKLLLQGMFGLFLIAIFAGVGYWVFPYLKLSPIQFQAGNVKQLTATGKIFNSAVSPDGKLLAYIQNEKEKGVSLWLRHIAAERNVVIIPPSKTLLFGGLTFSPDSNYIYYFDQSALYQMPTRGGVAKKILDKVQNGHPTNRISFSPDGRQFAFRQFSSEELETSLIIANVDGTSPQMILKRQNSYPRVQIIGSPAWSPDGKIIIVPIFDNSFNILAINVEDKTETAILPENWSFISHLTWLPDSKSFLAIGHLKRDEPLSNQIWQISYTDGKAQKVSNDFGSYTTISLTADGRSLAATTMEQSANILTMNPDDTSYSFQPMHSFGTYDGVDSLALTSDGAIVYSTILDGKPNISVKKRGEDNPVQLVSNAAHAAISPDGHFLVYQKRNKGLYRRDMWNNSEIQLKWGYGTDISFSIDGSYIFFTGWIEKRRVLWRLSIDGGDPRWLDYASRFIDNSVVISPDGKTIALVDGITGQLIVGDSHVPPSKSILESVKKFDVKPSFPHNSRKILQWTLDGRAINYLITKDNVSNIWRQPIDGGKPQQITDFKDGLIFNYAFSPDGKRLALSRGMVNSDVVMIENAQ